MLESLNTGVFEYEKLKPEEMKARGILGRLVGVMADTVNPTRNGRSYSEQLWENVFNNPIMQERIENKCCFGELGHPLDREETDMEKIAICMDSVPKKDSNGKLQAVFNILDTPNGRILKTLCDYGCNIGISSRGSGDLVQDFDGNESVDPDTYNCEGWDAVLIPAVKEARLQYVNESLEKTRYRKSLRTKLQESINKEDVDKKKAVKESLRTFLGEGIWDEIEDDVTEPEVGPEPDEDFVDELDANMEDGEQEENILDAPPGGEDEFADEAFPDEEEPFDDVDSQVDDMFGGMEDEPVELEPPSIDYKGVKIVHDEETGKYVCEIDQETYVFNSEKNAKIWIDMNEKEVKDDLLSNEVEEIADSNEKKRTSEEEEAEDFADDLESGSFVQESLVEEQIGRDSTKEDKDIDEVQEPETEEDEEKDDKKKKVTVTIDESYPNANRTSDEIIADFVERCKERLNEFPETDIELEIPEEIDDDESFWYDFREALYDNGISFSVNETNTHNGVVYIYFLISKRQEDESIFDESLEEFENLLENDEESTLKYSEESADEADNIGSEVDSLQEMLDYNIKLEQRVIELQEKLSVSHAEESKKREEIDRLKESVAKLSQVSKENKALKEKLRKLQDSSTKLNESVNKSSSKVTKLTEQLKTVKEERDSASAELEALKESYSDLEKDSTQLKEQFTKRFDKQNQLLEKYQKITKNAVDRYINLQATNLGVKAVEIRNKLPDKFSFADVDSICEELRDYKLSVSKLPFNTSKPLRESNVRVNNLSKGLAPRNEMDELTDYDMKLMELFK